MIHVVLLFCIVDIVWMCVIIPFWTSGSTTEYWEGLKGLHTFGIIFSFLELLNKLAIGHFLAIDYKNDNNDIKQLLSFKYEE